MSAAFTPRSRPTVLLALALVLLAAAPAASAEARPKRPDLAAVAVSAAPALVGPGQELTARGRVLNAGTKLGRGPVSVYLSPRQLARPGGELLGRDRVAAARESRAAFAVSGEIAAELGEVEQGSAENRFYAVACVKRRGDAGPARCAVAERPTRVRPFAPGARSLGEPIFPQLGNGGYDAEHYEIAIAYDPGDPSPDDGDGAGAGAGQRFLDGTSTTMSATATQNLSEFSLDFQPFQVSEVRVDGVPAEFAYEDTDPFADPQVATQFKKLVVTPAGAISDGEDFTVEVDYTGTPREMVDADESLEGWIQACYTPDGGERTCDGAFTVNEPNGTQTWAPVNNVPSDKATVDTEITVPTGKTALGAGELVAEPAPNTDGTTTWSWSHDVPTSPYLYSATVGDFDFVQSSMTAPGSDGSLPVYTAIDSSATPQQKTTIADTFERIPAVQNFIAENLFGPYPYGSTGGVADRTDNVGYALENASKPHYAGGDGGPSVGAATQVHELAHQWMGDSVSPDTWLEIGFNEGWATWTEWEYDFVSGASAAPAAKRADRYYRGTTDWSLAPADFDEPVDLFAEPQYEQTATMIQYLREIIGERRFGDFASTVYGEHAGETISWKQFIGSAVDASEFGSTRAERLRDFFRQWLYSAKKPAITPKTF